MGDDFHIRKSFSRPGRGHILVGIDIGPADIEYGITTIGPRATLVDLKDARLKLAFSVFFFQSSAHKYASD